MYCINFVGLPGVCRNDNAVSNLRQACSLYSVPVHSAVGMNTWLKTVVDISVQTFSRINHSREVEMVSD